MLYSEAARRTIVDARALIAERGYRPTAEDIRKCRQEILRERDQRRWKMVTLATDFYSMSGCRDLLFNIVEHRFAIHQIKEFLDEQGLSFLGFDLDPVTLNRFRRLFPGAALADLDRWHIYEEANPQTFQNMYVFSVRKRAEVDRIPPSPSRAAWISGSCPYWLQYIGAYIKPGRQCGCAVVPGAGKLAQIVPFFVLFPEQNDVAGGPRLAIDFAVLRGYNVPEYRRNSKPRNTIAQAKWR